MEKKELQFWHNVVRSISDSLMIVGFDGGILYANKSAEETLGMKEHELTGKKFAELFFEDERNDQFSQTVLDAIYDPDREHMQVVPYYNGEKTLHLRVTSSFLTDGEEKHVAVIVIFSDLSELMDLREAVKSLETIRELNSQLELRNQLISETFGRYLSDEIVRHLLDTPDGLQLGGTKQNLTILMSDLRGFTAMCQRMEPADLIAMLNHYFAEMTEAIQRYRGTIIEFLGDGIFAVFGAPEITETHAADAVAAALEMEVRMEGVNRWNAERGYPTLEMGIGIDTGEVIVGNIGSEKRAKYGVVGSHVNLCGRIESYTVGGQVLISPTTKELIGTDLEVAKTMTVYPKGVNGELVITQVTGIGEPYNVHETLVQSAMHQLDHPVPVCFRKLEGKHETAEYRYGGLTAVARDGAEMETAEKLELFENLQVRAGGKLFCKVVDKTDRGYRLQYTAIPTGYAEWLKEARS